MLLGLLLITAVAAAPFSDEQKKEILNLHNGYRCMHGAEPVTWNENVAEGASTFIDDKKSLTSSKSYELKPPFGPAAENIAISEKGINIKMAVDNWYKESRDCEDGEAFKDGCANGRRFYPNGARNTTGHFTAMVWKGVKKIGCGLNAESTLLLCRYWSADTLSSNTANMKGAYVANVGHRVSSFDACKDLPLPVTNPTSYVRTPVSDLRHLTPVESKVLARGQEIIQEEFAKGESAEKISKEAAEKAEAAAKQEGLERQNLYRIVAEVSALGTQSGSDYSSASPSSPPLSPTEPDTVDCSGLTPASEEGDGKSLCSRIAKKEDCGNHWGSEAGTIRKKCRWSDAINECEDFGGKCSTVVWHATSGQKDAMVCQNAKRAVQAAGADETKALAVIKQYLGCSPAPYAPPPPPHTIDLKESLPTSSKPLTAAESEVLVAAKRVAEEAINDNLGLDDIARAAADAAKSMAQEGDRGVSRDRMLRLVARAAFGACMQKIAPVTQSNSGPPVRHVNPAMESLAQTSAMRAVKEVAGDDAEASSAVADVLQEYLQSPETFEEVTDVVDASPVDTSAVTSPDDDPPGQTSPERSSNDVEDRLSNPWLRLHNMYRCRHGVPDVTWSEDLAKQAHDAVELGVASEAAKSLPAGEGQSIATHEANSELVTPGEAVQTWYSQSDNCMGGPAGFTDGCEYGIGGKQTLRFTALVWKGLTAIGCATNGAGTVSVCRYSSDSTPVNTEGSFKTEVYHLTKTESQCPSEASSAQGGASAFSQGKVRQAAAAASTVAITKGLSVCAVFKTVWDAAQATAKDEDLADAEAQRLSNEAGIDAALKAASKDFNATKKTLKSCNFAATLWAQNGDDNTKCERNARGKNPGKSQSQCQQLAENAGYSYYQWASNEGGQSQCLPVRSCDSPITGTSWKIFKKQTASGQADFPHTSEQIDRMFEAYSTSASVKKEDGPVFPRAQGDTHAAKAACVQAGNRESVLASARGESTSDIAASAAVACLEAAQAAGAGIEQALKYASDVATNVIGGVNTDEGRRALMKAAVRAKLRTLVLPSDAVEMVAAEAGAQKYETIKAGSLETDAYEAAVKFGTLEGDALKQALSTAVSVALAGSKAKSLIETVDGQQLQLQQLEASITEAQKVGVSLENAVDVAAQSAARAAFLAAEQAGATKQEMIRVAAREDGRMHKALGLEWKKASMRAAGHWARVAMAKEAPESLLVTTEVCQAAHNMSKDETMKIVSGEAEIWSAGVAGQIAADAVTSRKGALGGAVLAEQIAGSAAAECAQELGLWPTQISVAAAQAAAKVLAKASAPPEEVRSAAKKAAIAAAIAAGANANEQDFQAKVESVIEEELKDAKASQRAGQSVNPAHLVPAKKKASYCGNKALILNGGTCDDFSSGDDIRKCGQKLESVSGVLYPCHAHRDPESWVCKISDSKRCAANTCGKACMSVR
mmetsp:Transcript_9626/g.17288  ORF Transcript_9626/g.17288 Transcript_9626/m.17288 type:complete len:1449 (+) Transcript_9626:78-4424(+)